MFPKKKWSNLFVVSVLALVLLAPQSAPAQGGSPSGVLGPAPLSALWWQWVLSIPASVNPLIDQTGANCGQNQGVFSERVFFLSGTFNGFDARTCTIPAGKILFFPVLNAFWTCDFPAPAPCNYTVGQSRAIVASQTDQPLVLETTVDGVAIKNLGKNRTKSPVFSLDLAPDNLLGFPPGTYEPAVADGYYVLVNPLAPGPHVIHLKGVSSDGLFTTEVIYYLNVQP